MLNKTPKSIWIDDSIKKDCYVEFETVFLSHLTSASIDIAVDTDYALYLNGKFIDSNAYQSYPGKLYFDTLGIYLNKGENTLVIKVYYNGADTFATYYKKNPCLWFKVYSEDEVIAASDENTLSRYDNNYKSFNEQRITNQLGYKVIYDFCNDNYRYKKSILTKDSVVLEKRPNKKLLIFPTVSGEFVKGDGKSQIFDLGKERVGYLSISIVSDSEKDIFIGFGEHMKEGRILDLLGGRDFRFNIHLKKGLNDATFPLRRIGCRYLSIDTVDGLVVNRLGLVPVEYPFTEKEYQCSTELDKQIIEIAKDTIKCCYHEHFEDCPWREQAQYTFDMRCTLLGYHKVYKNEEAVKSSIQLILDNPRDDGDLDLTFPSQTSLVIPSFTLHFVNLISEYLRETNDVALVSKSISKIETILNEYLKKTEEGLLSITKDETHWIFYEWKTNFDGNGSIVPKKDYLLNVIFLHALQQFKSICETLKIEFKYGQWINIFKTHIVSRFYDTELDNFVFAKENKVTSELMLAYAILTDIIPEKNEYFASKIMSKKVAESTNSFKSFVYEALLRVNPLNKRYIVNEIRHIYSAMINDGATTFYETNLGYLDFDKAGSLCHGWNAFIIQYLTNE